MSIKWGVTIKDESTGAVITGLSVKLVKPGDNWSSGDNVSLTEVGSSGYYENDAIAEADEGYKEIWTDNSGSGADSGLRAIVGHNDEDGTSMDGTALNKNFGDDAGEIPAINGTLVNGNFAVGYLDGGIVKLKDSGKKPADFLESEKTVGIYSEAVERKITSERGNSSIGSNSFKIDVNVPQGAKIIAVLCRVEVALDRNFDIIFQGGLTYDVKTSIDYALNTKESIFIDPNANSPICDSEVDITIQSTAETNFAVEGQVRCSVVYEELTDLEDYGT